MRRGRISGALACVLAPLTIAAAETTTNAALGAVADALRPVLERLDPVPAIEYPEFAESLQVIHLPRTYKIHGRSKTGEFSTNVLDEIGPSQRGFVLRVHLQPGGEVNQACTPQTIREPYWLTDLDVTPLGRTDRQVYWALSYAGRTPTNILAGLRAAVRSLEKGPAAAPEDGMVVTRVSGGPPLLSADGRPVQPSRTVVADLRGARFEAVRKDVEAAVALLGKERTWWDVGPDASFLSAEVTLGTNRYTLNSWFPLERDNPRIAVSENRGLVAVSGLEEKKRIESGNGAQYRTLTGLFEKALAGGARTPAAPPR